METVVIRLWAWPADAVAPRDLRGVVRLIRTGEERAFTSRAELVAVLEQWAGSPTDRPPTKDLKAT